MHRNQIVAQQFHTLTLQTLLALPSPVPRRNQKMFKPEFFEYLTKTREAEMGVADVKAWLGRTGSFRWGKEDVELHLTTVLPHMGSKDILGAHFSSSTKGSRTDAPLEVVRLQLIARFHIYHTVHHTLKKLELQNSTRRMESRVRKSRPRLSVLPCVVFRLQPYHLQTISGVLKTILKSSNPYNSSLSRLLIPPA